MTDAKLTILVSQAVALHRDITIKTEQLKALKGKLIREARRHPETSVATEGGGSRWAASGTDGCIARVHFPAQGLKSEVDEDSDVLDRIKKIAGKHFTKLFVPVTSFHLVANFRTEVAGLLAAAKSKRLLKLLLNPGAPRVSFETANKGVAAAAKS